MDKRVKLNETESFAVLDLANLKSMQFAFAYSTQSVNSKYLAFSVLQFHTRVQAGMPPNQRETKRELTRRVGVEWPPQD